MNYITHKNESRLWQQLMDKKQSALTDKNKKQIKRFVRNMNGSIRVYFRRPPKKKTGYLGSYAYTKELLGNTSYSVESLFYEWIARLYDKHRIYRYYIYEVTMEDLSNGEK